MKSKAPRGTRDILPGEAYKWHFLEGIFRDLCRVYNYAEIRTPVFEETEIFVRTVGEDSDVVNKEMYTFNDRGGRYLALRPEGTAGVARAYIENGFYNQPQPVKLYYYGPMFRYDRPQAGRQRQFYQMGIEIFGSSAPLADVEVIKFTADFFRKAGFNNLNLHLNSVGCRVCRPSYHESLRAFVKPKLSFFCRDCQRRAESNPMRLLDCKEEKCRELMEDPPRMEDFLCSSCRDHFEEVKKLLSSLNVPFELDPRLVRGLDYYTSTAFEFISPALGGHSSLGGGGRYDNLVEACGGPPTPGVGMAVGVERILLAMEKEGILLGEAALEGVFIAVEDPELFPEGLNFLYFLREAGLRAETDYMNRSLKAKMRFAHRQGFRYVVILGEEAKKERKFVLRDMEKKQQQELSFEELVARLTCK